MSRLANGNGISEVGLQCDHDEGSKLNESDTVNSSCKSSQSMTVEDHHIPLPVKKLGDMNGMALTTNCEKTSNPEIVEEPSSTSSTSSQNTDQTESEEITLDTGKDLQPSDEKIEYVGYESELQMGAIMALITKDLSEPYSIYTYRYFIHNWPNLCFLAMHEEKCVGAIVCKLDVHKNMVHRGYIAMLAVEKEFRRHKIGTKLVKKAIKAMIEDNCDEVVLETEITNKAALHLYEKLGFVRDKRLFRYYLNGVDALRLKLWLR